MGGAEREGEGSERRGIEVIERGEGSERGGEVSESEREGYSRNGGWG